MTATTAAEATEAEATEATEEQQQEEVETKPAPTEDTIPKSDVERIVKDRLARERRKWSKEQKQKVAEAEDKQPQEPAASADEDRLSALHAKVEERMEALAAKELEADFRTATGGLEVDESRRKYLRWAYENDRETFDSEVKAIRAPDQPPEAKGPGPNLPGAPNGVPPGTVSDDPYSWSADVVAQKQKDGTFLKDLNGYRAKLPGGGGGLFPEKEPGKK